MDIDFLDLNDVLTIHRNQLELYGGSDGVRDNGLLESAIAQPQAVYDGNYLHEFPFEMAAAYLFHIVQNHPFLDGNKRTGAAVALVFLDFNGIELDAPEGAIYGITIDTATGKADKAVIADFFRSIAK